MKEIGEKIKELRLKHGLTLKEVGNAIEFNYSNLSKIERGQRKPGVEVLESLSNFFDIDISYFFNEPSKGDQETNPIDPEVLYLNNELKRKNISIDELKALIERIDQSNNSSQ